MFSKKEKPFGKMKTMKRISRVSLLYKLIHNSILNYVYFIISPRAAPGQQATKFIKYYGTPIWADLENRKSRKKLKKSKKIKLSTEGQDSDQDDGSEAEENADFFQQTGNFLIDSKQITNSTRSLPKKILDIKNCTDANKEDPDKV